MHEIRAENQSGLTHNIKATPLNLLEMCLLLWGIHFIFVHFIQFPVAILGLMTMVLDLSNELFVSGILLHRDSITLESW